MSKKLLSIDGWNPEGLHTGDRVICITRSAGKHYIHTGVVGKGFGYPEEESKDGPWYVINDINGKKLYPYTQDTCLIGPGLNEVNKVGVQIVELPYAKDTCTIGVGVNEVKKDGVQIVKL